MGRVGGPGGRGFSHLKTSMKTSLLHYINGRQFIFISSGVPKMGHTLPSLVSWEVILIQVITIHSNHSFLYEANLCGVT